ncbi:unnamed protein product [Oikopleura dioica]|uniref:ribonuclease H n=1 Tax=Oikopleura dioica TaxID=34765 RepID=E4XEH5_OIKDI|nr:unnamed protein product [Oikopleura dioica]
MNDVEPKTLSEAAVLISSLVKQIKSLESKVSADAAQEGLLRPIIEELKIEKETLNETLGSFPNPISSDYQQRQSAGNSTDGNKEESWVATIFSRHMLNAAKLDASSDAAFIEFLGRCDIFHKAYIKSRPSREQFFISSVYSQFDLNVERSIGAQFLECSTWKSGRELLIKSFGAKSHYFLTVSEALDIEYDSERPVGHYTSLAAQKMEEAKNAITSSFFNHHKRQPTVDDVFDIWTATLLYTKIRVHDPDTFNAIYQNLSNVFDITELTRLTQSAKQNRVEASQVTAHFQKKGWVNKKGKKRNNKSDEKKEDKSKKMHTTTNNDSKNDDLEPFPIHFEHVIKKNKDQQVYFAQASIFVDSTRFDTKMEVDTGAQSSILSSSCVPDLLLKQLTKCPYTVTGFNTTVKPQQPLGILKCRLAFNDGPAFTAKIAVMPGDTFPNLLGRDILDNDMTDSFKIDNTARTLTLFFNEAFTQTENQTIKLQGVRTRNLKQFRANQNRKSKSASGDPAPKDDKAHLTNIKCAVKQIKAELNISLPDDAEPGEKIKIAELIWKFKDVFGHEGESLGKFPHPVPIPTDGTSRNIGQHPIPVAFYKPVTDEISRMLSEDVIFEVKDQGGFNSPVLPIVKKDGSIRLCINFKNSLNKCLSDKSDPYHLPSMEDTLTQIGSGNRYFSCCDLRSGYWQCEIKESDRYKTSFQWGGKSYAFKRLPFGYRCSGNIFSRIVNQILDSSPTREKMLSYIDDVICFEKSFSAYYTVLENFFKSLRKFNAKLKSDKCSFSQYNKLTFWAASSTAAVSNRTLHRFPRFVR